MTSAQCAKTALRLAWSKKWPKTRPAAFSFPISRKKDVSSKARLDSSLDLQGCALSMSNSIQSLETRKVTNVLSLSLCQMAFYNPSKLWGNEVVCLWSSLLQLTVEHVSYLNFWKNTGVLSWENSLFLFKKVLADKSCHFEWKDWVKSRDSIVNWSRPDQIQTN